MIDQATIEERRARLEARATRSAAKPTQGRWPRRFVLFGPRVVPLRTFLLSQAVSHRNLQKDLNRLTATIHKLERGVAKRTRSLEEAHEYITLLKDRLRASSALQDGYLEVADVTALNKEAPGAK